MSEENEGGVKVTGDAVENTGQAKKVPDSKKPGPKVPEKEMIEVDLSHFTGPMGHPRKWVIIRDTGVAHESKQPFQSLNGWAVKCQRNVPVHLPIPLIEAMKLCVYTKYEKDETTGNDVRRDIPRFTFEDVPEDQIPQGE
jgi:hypothetical protein